VAGWREAIHPCTNHYVQSLRPAHEGDDFKADSSNIFNMAGWREARYSNAARWPCAAPPRLAAPALLASADLRCLPSPTRQDRPHQPTPACRCCCCC
jgi:hypothetical protein